MRKLLALLVCALLISGCGAFHRSGDNNLLPASYSVEEIPLSEGDYNEVVVDINDEGEIAYAAYVYNPPGVHPVRADNLPAAKQTVKVYSYSKNHLTTIAKVSIGTYMRYKIDTNNVGQGVFNGGTNNHGSFFDEGSFTELIPFPNSNSSNVYAINDLGQVVGESDGKGFLWESGNAEVLNPEEFIPCGINNLGRIAGTFHDRAVLLGEHGSMTDLGSPPGCPYSFATAINENGQIVGYGVPYVPNGSAPGPSSANALYGDIEEGYRAFIWRDGAITEIGAGLPLDINDAGIVVGRGGSAFVYCDGKRENLADMVPPDSGWTFEEAQAINNDGWIVGKGRYNGHLAAFLLKPQ